MACRRGASRGGAPCPWCGRRGGGGGGGGGRMAAMSPQQEHLGPARSASVSGEGRGFAAADSKKVRPEALPVPTGDPLREIEGRGRRGIWGYGVSAGGSWRSLGILRVGSAPGCKGGAARPGKGLWGQRGAARGEPGGVWGRGRGCAGCGGLRGDAWLGWGLRGGLTGELREW